MGCSCSSKEEVTTNSRMKSSSRKPQPQHKQQQRQQQQQIEGVHALTIICEDPDRNSSNRRYPRTSSPTSSSSLHQQNGDVLKQQQQQEEDQSKSTMGNCAENHFPEAATQEEQNYGGTQLLSPTENGSSIGCCPPETETNNNSVVSGRGTSILIAPTAEMFSSGSYHQNFDTTQSIGIGVAAAHSGSAAGLSAGAEDSLGWGGDSGTSTARERTPNVSTRATYHTYATTTTGGVQGKKDKLLHQEVYRAALASKLKSEVSDEGEEEEETQEFSSSPGGLESMPPPVSMLPQKHSTACRQLGEEVGQRDNDGIDDHRSDASKTQRSIVSLMDIVAAPTTSFNNSDNGIDDDVRESTEKEVVVIVDKATDEGRMRSSGRAEGEAEILSLVPMVDDGLDGKGGAAGGLLPISFYDTSDVNQQVQGEEESDEFADLPMFPSSAGNHSGAHSSLTLTKKYNFQAAKRTPHALMGETIIAKEGRSLLNMDALINNNNTATAESSRGGAGGLNPSDARVDQLFSQRDYSDEEEEEFVSRVLGSMRHQQLSPLTSTKLSELSHHLYQNNTNNIRGGGRGGGDLRQKTHQELSAVVQDWLFAIRSEEV